MEAKAAAAVEAKEALGGRVKIQVISQVGAAIMLPRRPQRLLAQPRASKADWS